MSNPTIDEMLEWIGGVFNSTRSYDRDRAMREAVRAILEQHRYPACAPMEVGRELKTIRAFVERVEARWQDNITAFGPDDPERLAHRECVQDELAAMEAEVKQ